MGLCIRPLLIAARKKLNEKLVIMQNHVFKLNFMSNPKYLHGHFYLDIGKSMKIIRKYKETSAEGETSVLK